MTIPTSQLHRYSVAIDGAEVGEVTTPLVDGEARARRQAERAARHFWHTDTVTLTHVKSWR